MTLCLHLSTCPSLDTEPLTCLLESKNITLLGIASYPIGMRFEKITNSSLILYLTLTKGTIQIDLNLNPWITTGQTTDLSSLHLIITIVKPPS